MDIENLKTFITLSKLKNFTQTAEQHFIVQSTVTNRIMELEKELGKKLFIRDKKNVSLTEEGLSLLSYAKRIVELEEAATREISLLNSYCDTLRIGSVNTVYDCHLYPYISTFIVNNKDIAIKIIIDHSSTLIRMLHDDVLDIIFTYIPINKKGYECIPFKKDELILVTSPKNFSYPRGITKDELKNLEYLYCDFFIQNDGNFIKELFPKHYPFPFEIDKSTKLIDYLKDGIGYSFIPKSLIHKELYNKELIQIELLDFESPIIQSYYICSSSKLKSNKIDKLINSSIYNYDN